MTKKINIKQLIEALNCIERNRHVLDKRFIPITYTLESVQKIIKGKRYKSYTKMTAKGKARSIDEPCADLKRLQVNLKIFFQDYYHPLEFVNGFVKKRNIRRNSKPHCNKRSVLKLDLESFFPNIRKNRIIAFMQSSYVGFDNSLSVLVSEIACFQDKLPQGSPCSPIISNMLCQKLDHRLSSYCLKNGIEYTRFADDLTFSADKELSKHFQDRLSSIITDSGFTLNMKKTRLLSHHERQSTTGVVINKFPNLPQKQLKQTRAIIHSIKKLGLRKAARIAKEKSLLINSKSKSSSGALRNFLSGRVSLMCMIRGKKDKLYLQYKAELNSFFMPLPLKSRPTDELIRLPLLLLELELGK